MAQEYLNRARAFRAARENEGVREDEREVPFFVFSVPAGESVLDSEGSEKSELRPADSTPEDAEAIAWRVDAMRDQVPESGCIPFLVARPGVPSADGRCWSCGDPLATRQRYRCRLCVAAVEKTLVEAREQ